MKRVLLSIFLVVGMALSAQVEETTVEKNPADYEFVTADLVYTVNTPGLYDFSKLSPEYSIIIDDTPDRTEMLENIISMKEEIEFTLRQKIHNQEKLMIAMYNDLEVEKLGSYREVIENLDAYDVCNKKVCTRCGAVARQHSGCSDDMDCCMITHSRSCPNDE